MEKTELYFVFPTDLTEKQEQVFVGYVAAVRDTFLDKVKTTLSALRFQMKIPFNPSKPIVAGLIAKLEAIEDGINRFFILEPIDKHTYRLELSGFLNMDTPLAKSRAVENIAKAFTFTTLLPRNCRTQKKTQSTKAFHEFLFMDEKGVKHG